MGHVGTTSTCMDDSGGPWRSLRIAQAYIVSGTWPSGGISPSSYRFLSGTGCDLGLAIADMPASLAQTRWRRDDARAARDHCSLPESMLHCNRLQMSL